MKLDGFGRAYDGSPNLKTHLQWAATLPGKVLCLNGQDEPDKNADLIAEAYRRIH